jgi:hypothetical protein
MTAIVERPQEISVAYTMPADARFGMAKITAIKSQLSASWPPVMIVLGLILTLVWTIGLAWLSLRLVF